jgi:hypothetical protein
VATASSPGLRSTNPRVNPHPGTPLTTFESWILHDAPQYGLDPFAVIADALTQGGISGPTASNPEIGDSGTSFGPFQLHKGGALPTIFNDNLPLAQQWSWSRAGIDYGLAQMAGTPGVLQAKGGEPQAVAIVTKFGRGANPAADTTAVEHAFMQYTGQIPGYSSTSGDANIPWFGFGPGGGGPLGVAKEAAGGLADATGIPGAFTSVLGAIKWVFNNGTRILEVIAGSLLVLIGIAIVGKGAVAGTPAPVRSAAGRIS